MKSTKQYIAPRTECIQAVFSSVLMLSNNVGFKYDETNGIDPVDAF